MLAGSRTLTVSYNKVLHVGCGGYAPEKLHPRFRGADWREVRLDIDPDAKPDIVASMTDMAGVESGSMNAVFSSHNLEHLYPHEVPVALAEFRRVLAPSGFALITLPDLQSVAQLVAEGKATEPAYMSQLGPISPLDILYGFGPALARNNLFMAHHTGFTGQSLLAALSNTGFAYSVVQRNPASFALWAIGFANRPSDEALTDATDAMLPLNMALKASGLVTA
jgi:SAM-dependent methyltransferase